MPGAPQHFFLGNDEGEFAHLFDSLVTVKLTGDETDGQFGVFTLEAPKGDTIPAHAHDDVHEACARIGAVLELHQVARPGYPGHHDALRLAAAYRDILDRPRTAR